ncbi:MAG: DNA-binding protein WhiA [Porcipelethomonas sp.]
MASFSNDVKKELVSGITDKDKRYACLYGILLYCKNLSADHISFTTESVEFAQMFQVLVRSVFRNMVHVKNEVSERKNGGKLCSLTIDDRDEISRVLNTYNIRPEKREINLRHIVNNSLNVFLAGIFFICGSVSDPYKEYHLEFTVPDEMLYSDLHDILLSIGIDGRKTQRKGVNVLYIKDSENIEDILTFIGARQSTIDIMNIKIYKDVRNKANRIANCDSANIDKVIAAAAKQTEDIKFIMENNEFDKLPTGLREVSELRLENPEMTLQEIGELLPKPIGRSGVMRRFKKISLIADEIRKNTERDPGS